MTLQAVLGNLRLAPTRTYPLSSASSKNKRSESILRLRGGCASASNIDDYDTTKTKKGKKKKKGSKGLSAGAWMGCGGGGC